MESYQNINWYIDKWLHIKIIKITLGKNTSWLETIFECLMTFSSDMSSYSEKLCILIKMILIFFTTDCLDLQMYLRDFLKSLLHSKRLVSYSIRRYMTNVQLVVEILNHLKPNNHCKPEASNNFHSWWRLFISAYSLIHQGPSSGNQYVVLSTAFRLLNQHPAERIDNINRSMILRDHHQLLSVWLV